MRLHSTNDFYSFWGNLWMPPLLFRRRPPQSNCPSCNVLLPDNGIKLDIQINKSGISTTTPWKLTLSLHSLPPILHIPIQTPMQNYSKGARGLSVQLQVRGIFTPTTNSLSISSRQRSTRYAIHAGRNLPDKGFRYLRTVIVTAAVYRGFDSMLRLTTNISCWPSGTGQASNSIVLLSNLQSSVFLLNSRLSLFVETLYIQILYILGTSSPEVTRPFCRVP